MRMRVRTHAAGLCLLRTDSTLIFPGKFNISGCGSQINIQIYRELTTPSKYVVCEIQFSKDPWSLLSFKSWLQSLPSIHRCSPGPPRKAGREGGGPSSFQQTLTWWWVGRRQWRVSGLNFGDLRWWWVYKEKVD